MSFAGNISFEHPQPRNFPLLLDPSTGEPVHHPF